MRALPLYFALAFAISWGGILVVTRSTGLPDPGPTAQSVRPWVFVAMISGPSIASVVLTAAFAGRAGLGDLVVRFLRWRGPWPALLIAPAALAAVLLGLSAVSPRFTPGANSAAFAVAAGLCAGFFEELGWTGFATPRMLHRHGLISTGLALGVLWALWHALGDYWGCAVAFGALWKAHFVQWLIALSAFRLLMTWVYARAQSLLLAMLMHASFTGSQALLWPAVPKADEMLWYGIFGLVLWLVAALVVRREPGLWLRNI